MNSDKQINGFSLIELLIVVAIIGIIAAIAVPNLLASRRAANEGSAQSSLRSIHSSQAAYQATYGGGNFGDLDDLFNAKLVDAVLGSHEKSGYTFAVSFDPKDPVAHTLSTFKALANPNVTSGASQTGSRKFGIKEDGVLHAQTDSLGVPLTDAELISTTNVLGN